MHVEETRDFALIDRLTVGLGLPPSSEYLPEQGVSVLVAYHLGEPMAAAMVLEHGELDLPEVHLAVPPDHRGATTISAIAAFRHWLRVHREWENVWTYVDTPRNLRLTRALGFQEAFTNGGRTFLFYNIRSEVES